MTVSIGNNAFSGCSSLSSVFIGGSVTSIGSNAFNTFNNSLDSVFLLPRIPPLIQNDTFGHGYDFKIFYVPCGTTNDYQDAWEGGYQYDFSEEWTPYSITVGVDNSQMGTVSTVLTFCEVTISADANQGYHFSQWNDGDTNNPRTCILTQDTLFTAIFAADTHTATQGINVVTNKDETMIISKYDRILIDGLRGQDVSIYTIDGRMVATLPKVTEHVVVPVTTSGVYFVKIGTYPARKVVVIH